MVDTVDTLDTVHTVDNSPEEQRYGITPSTGDAHVAHAQTGDAHVAHAHMEDAHVAHAHMGYAHVAHAHIPNGPDGPSEGPRWAMWHL